MERQSTFYGAVLSFPNRGIHAVLAEIIKFRRQAVLRSEFLSQSGWGDALNAYMVRELEKIKETVSRITYNPDARTKEEIERDAANVETTLAGGFNAASINTDDILVSSSQSIPIVWDLISDPNIPQLTPDNCPNDVARMFITGLDHLFVQCTRLDSRYQPQMITKSESAMIINGYLNPLYTICQTKGGEANKSDIPTGVLPSLEETTFKG